MITLFKEKKSTTLFFVFISWLAVTGKFTVAGMTFPILGTMPLMSAAEYGSATLMILGIWLGREYTEKVKKANG